MLECSRRGTSVESDVAREKVTERELRRQMEGVWYDYRLAGSTSRRSACRIQRHQAVLRAQGSCEGHAGASSGAQLQGHMRAGRGS